MGDPLSDADLENMVNGGPSGETPEAAEERARQSIADQTESTPDPDPEPQKELFVVEEQGRTISLGQLVKRGIPTEVRYVMTGKSLPNSTGGIIDPYQTSVLVIADCVVDFIKPQYIRDSEQRVEKVILYVTLKPRRVQQALTEAGQVMLQEARSAEQVPA